MIRAQRIVRRDNDADRAINRGQFLDRENVIDVAEARAAILRREDDAEQAHLAELLHHVERKLAGLVPLHHVGRDLSRGKFANLATKLLLLLGQYEGIQAFVGFERYAHLFGSFASWGSTPALAADWVRCRFS